MGGLCTIKKDMENYINKIPGNINIHIIGTLEIIKKGLEKYVDRIQGTTSISELQKNDYSANSPHPQKRSVNQVNSLLPKCHGLDSVLQRLSKQAKITITI